jgi:hypothetical protein
LEIRIRLPSSNEEFTEMIKFLIDLKIEKFHLHLNMMKNLTPAMVEMFAILPFAKKTISFDHFNWSKELIEG